MSEKRLPRSSLLSLGGMLFPIVVHGIHLLIPLLITGGVSALETSNKHHGGGTAGMMGDPFMDGIMLGIMIVSVLFTIAYLVRIWRLRDCSRTAAWCYTGASAACFGLLFIVL
ncbi:hypothetical protein [Paenibacillus glycanilyticus]|uniref:Uncharacterized protein n=1 Tax=Paenibacillus glycanilyticus TaxID=126569 RepID=A0ABQ6G9K1_9BACL|nr:hypothetical protein [Paenibacillus glycanilyticus]GLX65966.1 hypothetical protein MU1_03100 [Paenibacillus glycanilyticus]